MSATVPIRDRYELPLTTESPAAADCYVEGLDRFLAQIYGSDGEIARAVELDEGFALARALSALHLMYRNEIADAKKDAAHARRLAVHATHRERQHVEAVASMVEGDGRKALRLVREHLDDFPRDMLMVRLASRLLILGCSGAGVPNFPEELLAILKPLRPKYGEDWSFLGQYAFAHHETGQFGDAARYAERSLDIRPDNANASHSVAHVFFETGDPDGGADFLGEWLDGYDRRGPFNVHLSWHQALFQLAVGRPESAVSLYESAIRPSVAKKNLGSLADAASLMWRMKIYGDGQPGPWEEVREIAMPAAEKPGPAFRDAHAALTFAGGGFCEQMGSLLDGLTRAAGNGGGDLAREVTLPLAKGIRAFAESDYQTAADHFDGIAERLPRIGGSHAQREVFEDTILEARIRANRFDDAQDMLRARLKRRTSVRDELWLTRTEEEGETEITR